VGADAAAVALSEAPGTQTDLTLVVDVGTNAEILLGDTEGVLACSSPTGPAFEGAQISSGQRAAPGAIERVEIDPETKEPRFKVIGSDLWSTDPGFAEATKGHRRHRHLRLRHHRGGGRDAHGGPSGRLGPHRQAPRPRAPPREPTGRTFAYLLHDGSAEGGPRIQVTQGDIRAIQLAKSALYAGARAPDGQARRGPCRPRGPGRGLRGAYQPETRDGAGHDPRCDARQGDQRGQRRRTRRAHGAVQPAAREEIEKTVRQIEKIETAVEPRFQEHFVNANAIPHAVDPFPELAKIAPLPAVSFGASGAQPGDGGGRRRRRRA
jgi:uncharacterized 2Fe-2S/4Fe-4S cluster protein (DUF4445 family)